MRITQALLSVGLAAALVAPANAQDPSAVPTYGSVELAAGFTPDPHQVSLTAGGSIDVNVGGCGYGYVASSPDYDLYWTAGTGSTLYIYARAGEDTTLLINLPDGSWICNDDGLGNRNPLVTIPKAPSGLYDIWVGTYGTSTVSATLYISELNPQ